MTRPYITLKFAQTIDGRIAARDGSSKWISCPESRKFAHRLRAENDGILVGVNTILKDDPSLTTRLVKGKSPARIIIDGKLRTPLGSRVVKSAKSVRTIVITTPKAPVRKIKTLERKGVKILIAPASKKDNVDIGGIVRILYRKGIKRLLVEGGGKTITSFIRSGLADRVFIIISPKILGSGVESIGDLGIYNIKSALKLRIKEIKRAGKDAIYRAYLKK
ncbi:MAG: hypothetical protein A2Z72_01025 [Omnitrophica bacterium RBG_13_46_9]|nr:MAG: hypothetical protein A2Z72_01025 [Omnitrophica bacterium RBG_13_46_9]